MVVGSVVVFMSAVMPSQKHAHNPVVIGYIVVELCTVDPVIDVDVTMGTVENMVVVMV
jgi:hypothetical protein